MDIYQYTPNKKTFYPSRRDLTKQKKLLIFCSLLFSISSFNAVANEDDYYKALEAEADTIHIDSMNSNKPTTANNNETKSWLEINKITQDQLDKFEAQLRSRFSKSFNTYQHLNNEQKAAVIQAYYINSSSLVAAIQQIYKFQFNKK